MMTASRKESAGSAEDHQMIRSGELERFIAARAAAEKAADALV